MRRAAHQRSVSGEFYGSVLGQTFYCGLGTGTDDGSLPPRPFYAVQGTAADLRLVRQWKVPDPPDIHEAIEINALFQRILGTDLTPLISGDRDVVWKSPRAWSRTLEDTRVSLRSTYEHFTHVAHTAGFEVPAFDSIPIDIVIQDMRKSPRPALARPTWARTFEVIHSRSPDD